MLQNKQNIINVIQVVIIVLLGLLVYANALHSEFHFDDVGYVVDNYGIRDISNHKAIWNILNHPNRVVAFYTFALNYHIHEMEVFGFHVTNLLIHLMNALCVFILMKQLLKSPRLKLSYDSKAGFFMPFLAGLLFVAHPLQIQAVTYITQRFASLATLFYLLSFICYCQGRLKKKFIFFIMALVAALLGLFTKQIVMTLPLVVLACEFTFFQTKKDWQSIKIFLLKYGWIFLVMFLVVPAGYAFKVQQMLAMTTDSGSHKGDVINSTSYALTQVRVVARYIQLLFFPIGQNLDYDFRTTKSILEPAFLGALILLIMFWVVIFKVGNAIQSYFWVEYGFLWHYL